MAALLSGARRWTIRAATAVLLALPAFVGSAYAAAAEDRSLKLFFTHTGERATITFKRDGKLDPRGLAQINQFLRDWRRNEPARMDPRLLDLVWEVYDRSGAQDYIHIVSAYRSPATNNMLRNRSRVTGVAKNSQHMLGKAMDFYLPGVKLATLRALAMQMQIGGVGFYPTSGSPFVHLDVGSVRAWPRMSRQELARIFPNGNTMHLPADGRPLPGYEQAVADYRRRVGPNSIRIASTAGDDDDDAGSSGSSLLTAMLPTTRSRAERALEFQTRPQPAGLTPTPSFIDLASISAPVPAFRPSQAVAESTVETASIDRAAIASAMRETSLPAKRTALREPSRSIARLRIDTVAVDPDGEFDRDDVLTVWALSPPGSSTGMSAPLLVRRTFVLDHDRNRMDEPLPTASAEEFDNGRFWSDG
ncbi:DUF882 domain-containing protein [Agrobacterium sp. P15N1-A]|uniref:DUF882 domain-containing protein n=1 Tax=Agrobacterium sp. P15N1-A TaxID=3342820 RepID=UPI0037D60910